MDHRSEARPKLLSSSLWENVQVQRDAMKSLFHPFVVSLAAQTLSVSSFQHYIAQDVFYLGAFAKAFGIARDNTADPQAKACLLELQQDVFKELELHKSLSMKWESGTFEELQPSKSTADYISFLLDTAAGISIQAPYRAVCTVAAMVPCMRLYAFLGQQIQSALPDFDSTHTFHDWISTYASADFEAAAVKTEYVLDRLASGANPELQAKLLVLYQRGMQLELSFFAGQPMTGCIKPSLGKEGNDKVFACDFDSTCSEEDSSPILADLAFCAQSMPDSSEKKARWKVVSEQYMKDFNALLELHLPHRADDHEEGSVNFEAKKQDFYSFLDDLSRFEVLANQRVVDSGVLAGISKASILQAGEQITLQPNCRRLLGQLSKELESAVHVISVCWSQSFIQGAIGTLESGNLQVNSNELEFNEEGVSTGGICWSLQTASDKAQAFDALLKSKSSGTSRIFSVYVGDSLTDVLPLLRADVGIVVGNSSSLGNVAKAFGISIDPLLRAAIMKSKALQNPDIHVSVKREGRLYRASGWEEIEAFLLSQNFLVTS